MTSNTVVSSSTLTGALAVKVSFGNEMRRANFEGSSFVLLRGLVAKLFELDPQVVVLKYQDEDGDNITMSSDGELQDALKAAQPKMLLRLVLNTKTPVPPPAPVPAPVPAPATAPPAGDAPRSGDSQGFGSWGPGHFGGPFGPHGAPHHGPHGGPHGGPHQGGPFGGPHHGGPHHGGPGPFGGPHHGGSFGPRGHGPFRGGHHGFRGRYSPFAAPFVPFSSDPNNNGEGCPPAHHWGGYNADFARHHQRATAWDKKAFKEHKRDVKKQIQLMKMKASTPEDFAAIREMKLQLKGYKKEVKGYKKDCKEWKEKKDKRDKKEKKDKERFAAKHVADLTIPDNSELPADTPVTKTWRLRNCGEHAWPVDSQLIFISHNGDNLNGPERVVVGTVQPQHEVDISVTFITPSEPGRYVGYYRMATANGAKFGQRVWVSFFVPVRPAVQPEVSALGALVNEITMD